jgi:hypothetical protein
VVDLPFGIGKPRAEEQDFAPQGDMAYAPPDFQTAQPQVSPAQWNYYISVQREAMREEMQYISSILEGSTPRRFTEDGNLVSDFPKETLRYLQVEDKQDPSIVGFILEKDYSPQLHMVKTNKNGNAMGKTVEVELHNPMCNAEGRSKIINWASLRLQTGTILSTYSINRIFELCKSDSRDLQRMIYTNRRRWEVKPTEYKALLFTIMDRVEAARRRALDGWEREIIGRQITVSLTGASQPKASPLNINSLFGKPKY